MKGNSRWLHQVGLLGLNNLVKWNLFEFEGWGIRGLTVTLMGVFAYKKGMVFFFVCLADTYLLAVSHSNFPFITCIFNF